MLNQEYKYRVYWATKPGFYSQYNGYKNLYADCEESAINIVLKLLKSDFPEYSRNMFYIKKIEILN